MLLSKKLLLFLLKLRENRDGRHLQNSPSGMAASSRLGTGGGAGGGSKETEEGSEAQRWHQGGTMARKKAGLSPLHRRCFRPPVRFPARFYSSFYGFL